MQPTPEMHHRCQSTINDLRVQPPFEIPDLLRAARRRHGRPIHLHYLPHGLGDLSGLLLDNGRRVEIWVVPDAPNAHTRHIVAHEVGHLLLGHRLGGLAPGSAGADALYPALLCRTSMPTGNDAGAETGSVDPRETEAELFATLLYTGPGPLPRRPPIDATRRDVLWRQEEMFSRPRRTLSRT